jgi:hypothetical protein
VVEELEEEVEDTVTAFFRVAVGGCLEEAEGVVDIGRITISSSIAERSIKSGTIGSRASGPPMAQIRYFFKKNVYFNQYTRKNQSII